MSSKSEPIEHVRVREKRLIGDPNVLTPHEVRIFFKACVERDSAVGLLLIAVFPANIYLAQTNGAALNTSPAMAWLRLPFQAVFIALAYWHSKI